MTSGVSWPGLSFARVCPKGAESRGIGVELVGFAVLSFFFSIWLAQSVVASRFTTPADLHLVGLSFGSIAADGTWTELPRHQRDRRRETGAAEDG
jgi:hypothetical protein